MSNKFSYLQNENRSANPQSPELGISREYQQLVEQTLTEAFNKNRDFLVHQIVKNFKTSSVVEPEVEVEEQIWVEIDSLSKLRGLVGGRFDSLKTRWKGAGFPLKSKKGEKIGDYEVNELGWIELESWILKQGYMARRREGILFEIRKK